MKIIRLIEIIFAVIAVMILTLWAFDVTGKSIFDGIIFSFPFFFLNVGYNPLSKHFFLKI